MAFSAKTEYGLVALIELASVHASGGVLQVAEIARRQAIPERYLEQMLSALRRAGVLRRRALLESTHLDQLLEERDALAAPLPMYFI